MEPIPKEFFVSKSTKQLEAFINVIFKHYRREGFPYFPTNAGYRDKQFNTLMEFDISNILKNNVLQRTTHGISLAWSYFPHAWDVRCGTMRTPQEAFNDDVIFRKLLHKTARLKDGISDSTVFSMLRMFTGVQAVSNFRPTAAAALYDYYAPRGVVWDMSGGWGGRLLGAIRAGVSTYIATEPSKKTVTGLEEIAKDYKPKKMSVSIVAAGSETFTPRQKSLDFCFTSPPYFDLEKYADEKTQSFKKFADKQAWVDGFLEKTFANCYHGLKRGKYMAINIADPKKAKGISLEAETIAAAKRVGFTHVNTLSLSLKSLLGTGQVLKYEPIFIFKK